MKISIFLQAKEGQPSIVSETGSARNIDINRINPGSVSPAKRVNLVLSSGEAKG